VKLDINTASHAGGGMYQYSQVSTNTNMTVDGNDAQGGSGNGGGGIAVADGTFSCDNCTVTNNQASGDDGGGFLVDNNASTATVTFTDSEFSGNTAFDKGGAFRCRGDCAIQITDTLVHDNTGNITGGVELGAGRFTCTATTAYAGGVYANNATSASTNTSATVPSGGGRLAANGTEIKSEKCDWGTGADDNSPHDISYHNGTHEYGDGASFDCTYIGCQ